MTDLRQAYFDLLADEWDEAVDVDRTRRRLLAQLRELSIGPSEHILDLGCGTGTSTGLLAGFLTDGGCVWGIDVSPRMIARARSKVLRGRIQWAVGSADALPLRDGSMDRIVCFSAWPHLRDCRRVVCKLYCVLKTGGRLHILHIDSRERINAVHAERGGAVGEDLLPPAGELSQLLAAGGFSVTSCADDDQEYVVNAVKRRSTGSEGEERF
jgi:ubiquinone/menaquinone biosynthesis C-methylase UbiE